MMSPADFVGPVNLGNPDEFTVRQLADLVIELTGSKSTLEFCELPADDPRQRQPNIALASSALSWTPKVGLAAGLGHTTAFFREKLT
jgi:UDP-glucuronate decarboxylase